MNKTEQFLNEYKRLEDLAIKEYGLSSDGSAISRLEQLPEFRNIKSELSYCREVRNLLQHKPKIQGSFAVEPSDHMIELLGDTIQKISNPPRAKNVAIPKDRILSRSMDDFVLPVMKQMLEKKYTHIPILENGAVIGVFSENTILSYLVREGIVEIDEKMTFADLSDYLPIANHTSESFYFIPQDMLLTEVNDLFEKALQKQERIGLVFTTHSGKEKEKILGIITAWDVAGAHAS